MCCCRLPSSSARSPVNASATRSPPQRKRACGWAAMCRWAITPTSARSSSTLPRPRRYAASSLSIVSSAACAGSRRRPTVSGFGRNAARQRTAPSAAANPSRAVISTHCSRTRRLTPAERSLRAGLLVDARGERLTPSHAVKKGRRYRYYVSAALITDAGTDREGWRLAPREIEEEGIRILADALASPASLVERVGAAGMPSDQVRKLLSRAARMAAALGGSPGERTNLIRELVEKVIVDENGII